MQRLFMLGVMASVITTLAAYGEDKPEEKGLFKDPEKLFSKMDENGDKKVSKAEFQKFLAGLPIPKLADKAEMIAEKMFERLDADKDGNLSADEVKKLGEALRNNPEKLKDLKGILKKKKDADTDK